MTAPNVAGASAALLAAIRSHAELLEHHARRLREIEAQFSERLEVAPPESAAGVIEAYSFQAIDAASPPTANRLVLATFTALRAVRS